MNIAIALDGPGGSGKSTIAKRVAAKLNIFHIDTGAMYRTVAVYCLKNNIDVSDKDAVVSILDDIKIGFEFSGGAQKIFLNGEDVSEEIRTVEVNQAVPVVSCYKKVREKLINIQRKLAKTYPVIMDGRDIASNVLPSAEVKIFLTADPVVRAKRRHLELKNKGVNIEFEDVLKEISSRDEIDSTREESPLIKTDDAVELDTTNLNLGEVTEKILTIIKFAKGDGCCAKTD